MLPAQRRAEFIVKGLVRKNKGWDSFSVGRGRYDAKALAARIATTDGRHDAAIELDMNMTEFTMDRDELDRAFRSLAFVLHRKYDIPYFLTEQDIEIEEVVRSRHAR